MDGSPFSCLNGHHDSSVHISAKESFPHLVSSHKGLPDGRMPLQLPVKGIVLFLNFAGRPHKHASPHIQGLRYGRLQTLALGWQHIYALSLNGMPHISGHLSFADT